MNEDMKNFIKSVLYFGLAVDYPKMDFVIRVFFYKKEKGWCDRIIKRMPVDHPARVCYEKVSDENFEQNQLIAFAKMSMYQLMVKENIFNFVYSDETLDELAEKICQININNAFVFVKENENTINNVQNELIFCFIILYRYLYVKEKLSKNVEFLLNNINIIEKYKFELLFADEKFKMINEKYNNILYFYDDEIEKNVLKEEFRYSGPYSDLAFNLCENKQYDLAEEYYKKYISFLEKCNIKVKSFNIANSLANEMVDYGRMLLDKSDNVNESAMELIQKAIRIREELVKKYNDKIVLLYSSIADSYNVMAQRFKRVYKNQNTIEYKEKYYELFKKAINYREELKSLNKFDNIKLEIDNYNKLGKYYYFIFEDEKAKENFKKALEICEKENIEKEWIDEITKNLDKIDSTI